MTTDIENERKSTICIGDESYDLILTTKATKEISKRYGGLDKFGEKLMQNENVEMALDEIIWLIKLLANQSVLIYNIKNKENPKNLLDEETIELLTTPHELSNYKNAIMESMFRGMKQTVKSEEIEENSKEKNK